MATEQGWFIYLVATAKGSLYTGITTDVERRLKEHQSGQGAKYLRGKGPIELVAMQPVTDRSLALKLEYQVKQLPPAQKRALLSNDDLFKALVSKHCVD